MVVADANPLPEDLPWEDPTLPRLGGGRYDGERVYRGKRWQMGKGQRFRAIANAETLGHRVTMSLSALPPAGVTNRAAYYKTPAGKKQSAQFMSTSFADWDAFEEWEAALPLDDKCNFELLYLDTNRPYLDIDGERDDANVQDTNKQWHVMSPEEVLSSSIAGLIDFMRTDYGHELTTTDFICADGSVPAKDSFHLLIPGVIVDRKAFGRKLALAKRTDPRLGFIDAIPYHRTQNFRAPFQTKRGKSNWLRPVSNYGAIQLHPVEGFRLRDFCASFVTDEDCHLQPIL